MDNSNSETSSATTNERQSALRWLEPRSVIVGGVAVAAIGLAFNWNWIVAVGFAPLLFTLPCMLMMGWMMWSMRPKKDANHPAPRRASTARTSDDPPATTSDNFRSTEPNQE